MSIHVFGIRHHGPGSARALRSALEALSPDVVLVEGPADATEALVHLADARIVPPVALLLHAVDEPGNVSFFPFAEFSPEWQAFRYAAERGVPSRFMDLPAAHSLVRPDRATDAPPPNDPEEGADDRLSSDDEERATDDLDDLRGDPIGMLAEAAGYTDRERWWEVQVEQRQDASGLFEGILEAMTALRDAHGEVGERELRREAYMRTVIRAAQKEGFTRIAVVCGAWHAPVLAALGPAKDDAARLKGLPKVKVAATWIPWTNARLSYRSGYGAGVDSPGWYGHVWTHGRRAPVVWAALAARLLREQDLDASSANVIETVRLAEALAIVREVPAPGLAELREAIEAVLCGGERARLALVRTKLEIGDRLGEVPDDVGQVPLMRSFERELKRLRLKLTTEHLDLELDLRKDSDRDRSRLFHRTRILDLGWAEPKEGPKGAGTFKERWRLAWEPEFAVELITANGYGNDVDTAASARLAERASTADLATLGALVESAILAFLPTAIDALLVALDTNAASSSDVLAQIGSLTPLARLVRYGDVRATRVDAIRPLLSVLFERVFVGLPPACTQIDDESAGTTITAIDAVHAACMLLDEAERNEDWLGVLRKLLDSPPVHPRIRGRACRLLLERHALAEGELARQAGFALSAGVAPEDAARWIEGLVSGEGLRLVHERELLETLDSWLADLDEDAFRAQLPLLRRAFSSVHSPERRAIARLVVQRGPDRETRGTSAAPTAPLDRERVARVLPVLAHLLGVEHV